MGHNDRSLLHLKDVTLAYEGGRIRSLNGVSLDVFPGESVALLGRSGSGKSSLLHLAAGLDRPDQGELLWSGRGVSSRREWTMLRRTEIGIVFQEFHLIPTLSALQNVELALMGSSLARQQRSQRAAEALIEVGLGQRAKHLPGALAGGERQRVAIARAVVHQPRLLLADEPTGSLDSMNAATVTELLFRLQHRRNMALLLATHDVELARRCMRTIHLLDGHVVEPATAGRAT